MELLSLIFELLFPASDPNIQYAFAPFIIPLTSMAMQLGSGIFGAKKGVDAGKELDAATQEAINSQQGINSKNQEIADWYNSEASKDYMDTDVAQSTLGKIREQYKNSVETSASNAARGGATAEARVATKGKLNEGYNSVLNNMVGYGTQYKNSMKQGYSNQLSKVNQGIGAINQMKISNAQGKVDSANNMTGNALSGLANTMGSTDWVDIFKK